MDAITYFLVNYGLYSLLLVIPAALLGIVYGWMAWGKYRAGEIESRERLEEAEKITHEVEIALSKERERFKMYQEAAEEGGTLPAPPDLEHRIVALRRDNEELEKILEAARKERAEAEASLAEMAKEKEDLSGDLVELRQANKALEGKLSAGGGLDRRRRVLRGLPERVSRLR